MILQALKVVLDEAELAERARAALGGVAQLKEVTFGLAPGEVRLGGKFQVGFAIPFETRWSLEVLDGGARLGVGLAGVSVGFLGLGADAVRAQVMAALAQRLEGREGVAVSGDRIVVDPAALAAARGVRLAGTVRRVEVLAGRVEVEIG